MTTRLDEGTAIAGARAVAAERGWRWEAPVKARRSRTWWPLGRRTWEVRTNAEHIGCNVLVVLDAATGRVVRAAWLPR
ncbi:MAG: hypothetical protein KBG28_15225 [Kofleriaceae bacterium]|jgi:hypothetical protein|nr:hypothetical protein [Kofleriaceae bacterium]